MNEQPISIAEARALVASSLWPRIRAFLWDFASLCDSTRLTAALSPGGSGELPRSLSITPHLARAAEQALGLTPFFHPFPADDGSRLLLLSREDYDRLAQFLGAIALAPALRRITAGAEVRALKAGLPGYREALSFAAYFHRFEALFKRFEPENQAANSAAVCSVGHSTLASALSSLPSELLLRQRLRFPEGSPADAALNGAATGDSSLVTRHSSLAGEARAAARLALKLFLPSEFSVLSA